MKVQISITGEGGESPMYAADITVAEDSMVLSWTQPAGPEETQPAEFCLSYMRPSGMLRILRSGDYQTDLAFSKAMRTQGTLMLPEGSFMLDIETRQLVFPEHLWACEDTAAAAEFANGEDRTIVLQYNMLLMDQEPISKEIAIHVFLD